MMDPRRYRQVRQIFDEVMALDAAARPAFLASQLDTGLRADVERLIAASDRATGVFAGVAQAVVTVEPERWEGRRLGPYEILHELGEGGMGVVYLARRADGAFEKQVAIKVVRQSLATREFLARFQREREILAKLEHPNIARLLDGGSTPNGLAYLVMEYVKGEPLLAFADSRRLRYEERLRLLRQIAEAVDYAHSQGIVHRDLKPSNILVSADGQVKLLDFGIASWQEPAVSMEASAPTIALSPAYASPEQARGERTTKASDIYSFAMVAYEVLTGLLPVDAKGASLQEVLARIVDAAPVAPSLAVRESRSPGQSEIGRLRRTPPNEMISRLERTADGPLLAALSKCPEDRPESASALMQQLEQSPNPDAQSTLWNSIRKELSQHSIAWISLIIFMYLVWTDSLQLKPVAWVAVGVAAAAYLLDRAGWLGWLGGNVLPWMLIAISGFAGRLPLLLTILILSCIWGYFYFRRHQVLGERIYVNTARETTNLFWLVVIGNLGLLVALLIDWNEPLRWYMPLNLLIQWIFAISMIPMEIRKGGVVVQGRVIRWEEIVSYRWMGSKDLALRLRESRLLSPGKEVRSIVPAEDVSRVQEELRNWLLELPSNDLSIAIRHESSYQ